MIVLTVSKNDLNAISGGWLTNHIRTLLSAENEPFIISFENDSYDFSAQSENQSCKKAILELQNLTNVTIDGGGAIFNLNGFENFICIENCSNIRVTNFKLYCGHVTQSALRAIDTSNIIIDYVSINGCYCAVECINSENISVSQFRAEPISRDADFSVAGDALCFDGCRGDITVNKCVFKKTGGCAVNILMAEDRNSIPNVNLTANLCSQLFGEGFSVECGKLHISDNVMTTASCAIRLAGGYTSADKTGMSGAVIENNHFKNCCYGNDTHTILLKSNAPPIKNQPKHRDFIIRDNYFECFGEISQSSPELICGTGILYAVSCENIRIEGNGYTLGNAYPKRQWEISPIIALGCQNITVC